VNGAFTVTAVLRCGFYIDCLICFRDVQVLYAIIILSWNSEGYFSPHFFIHESKTALLGSLVKNGGGNAESVRLKIATNITGTPKT
jgi:hypothetical protein